MILKSMFFMMPTTSSSFESWPLMGLIIFYKDAARFGLGVDIDDGFAALAVVAYLYRVIYGAIEGVVDKLAGIEAQEDVRLDI